MRRFAPGTDAAFAVSLINKKLLLDGVSSRPQLASHIEAVKPGNDSEEPISFGPTAPLLKLDSPWILQTVVAQSYKLKTTVKVVVCFVLLFSRFCYPFCGLFANALRIFNCYYLSY